MRGVPGVRVPYVGRAHRRARRRLYVPRLRALDRRLEDDAREARDAEAEEGRACDGRRTRAACDRHRAIEAPRGAHRLACPTAPAEGARAWPSVRVRAPGEGDQERGPRRIRGRDIAPRFGLLADLPDAMPRPRVQKERGLGRPRHRDGQDALG